MTPTLVNAATGVATSDIRANGTYLFGGADLDRARPFTFGASKTGAGAGATVQLFREVAGVKDNLDDAQVVTNASPKSWPNEYTLNGKRGVTVSGMNGGDDVLTLDIGQ